MVAEPMPDHVAERCPTCRGRGWLHVRSRPVYGSGPLKVTTTYPVRETCWDCGGDGRAAE